MFRAGLPAVTALLVHTRFMEQQLRSTWGFDRPIVLLPSFTPDVHDDGAARLAPPALQERDGWFTILYPSTFSPYKNFDRLLEAIALVRSRGVPVRLVTTVAPDARGFFERVAKLGIRDSVVNVGVVPLAHMLALYRSVDATIQLSLLEAYGLTYIEAFQWDRPQVVADLPFAREIAGDARLYVPPDSVERIAVGIARLAGDPALRADLVRRGRERLATVVVTIEDYARRIVDAVVQGTVEAAAGREP